MAMKPPSDIWTLSTTTVSPSDSWSLMLTEATGAAATRPSISSPRSFPLRRTCAVKFAPGCSSLKSAVAVKEPSGWTIAVGCFRNGAP
jgi:hypothetical protein